MAFLDEYGPMPNNVNDANMDEIGLDYSAADRRFERAIQNLKLGVGGKVPKLTDMERQILEFCHNRDMREFLREEFEKHPIILNEDGELVGRNPFDVEREEKKKKPYIYDPYQFEF